MTLFLFLTGIAFLIIGAEALVRGASKIAEGFGISPLIIGLTVVAFGTSSPELAVSIKGALADQSEIALGNVIGSNIFNVLFILGLSALIVPLRVSQQLIRLDVPLMIGLSVLVFIFALDLNVSRSEGILLLAGLLGYIILLFYFSQASDQNSASMDDNSPAQDEASNINWALNIALLVIGLALLVLGSRWLVDSAVSFAQLLGVSELVIGLTVIAAGTSLPEVVTSIIASIRGKRDIAVGNVVGSNIFNILGVLGFASILAPAGIGVTEAVAGFDIPLMIAVALACLPIFFTGGTISRWEAALLLGYYVAYTLYLVLEASAHDTLPLFGAAMLYFVIPITVVTILVVTVQEFRKKPD